MLFSVRYRRYDGRMAVFISSVVLNDYYRPDAPLLVSHNRIQISIIYFASPKRIHYTASVCITAQEVILWFHILIMVNSNFPVPLLKLFCVMSYLSVTPLTQIIKCNLTYHWAYSKLRLVNLIIGISPLRYHRAAPIACDGSITLGLWLGRSIIIPIICHRIPTGTASSL